MTTKEELELRVAEITAESKRRHNAWKAVENPTGYNNGSVWIAWHARVDIILELVAAKRLLKETLEK